MWNSCDQEGRVALLRHLIDLINDVKVRDPRHANDAMRLSRHSDTNHPQIPK